MENGRKIFSLDDLLKILGSKKTFLSKEFGVTDLAVFGSYAKNEQNENSDIDIFVGIKNDFKTFDNFMDLKFFLEELLINKKVDLVTKEAIREEFKTKVLMEAVNV